MRYHANMAGAKLLEKMRKSHAGWRIEDLQTLAASNGLDWRSPGRGGSHVIFSAEGIE